MGGISAVIGLPGDATYLVAGSFAQISLFAEPSSCNKWWWCRLTNGKATKPQAFFNWDWFNVRPAGPSAGRQLIVGADAKVHAVAGWEEPMRHLFRPRNYSLVYGCLQKESWQVEEVYKGRADDGHCDEPMIAAGGNRLAIAGTFESRTEDPDTRHVKYIVDKLVVWTKEEEGWRVVLTLKGVAEVEDLLVDAAGRLYLLYDTESQLMLLTGSARGWSKPIRLGGAVYAARMLVEEDGVVHIAIAQSYEGYYLRLEPISPVPAANESDTSKTR